MEKKRFILFAIADYYPTGGMSDSMFSFDTREELNDIEGNSFIDEYQVFDVETFRVGKGETPLVAFDRLGI
jgi:hypothetical protein